MRKTLGTIKGTARSSRVPAFVPRKLGATEMEQTQRRHRGGEHGKIHWL